MLTNRGNGVGRQLLAELVRRANDAEIFLTTLDSTTPFYAPAGFRRLERSEIPGCVLASRLQVSVTPWCLHWWGALGSHLIRAICSRRQQRPHVHLRRCLPCCWPRLVEIVSSTTPSLCIVGRCSSSIWRAPLLHDLRQVKHLQSCGGRLVVHERFWRAAETFENQ